MKTKKFNLIGGIALATIGAYVATKGFQDAIEISKSTDLNIIATGWAAIELATSTIIFKNSIKQIRQIFVEESNQIKSNKNKI